MDFEKIASLVVTGISKLADLIPLWLGAKTPEQREEIRLRAVKVVEMLDPHFAAVDASDKVDRDTLQAEIDRGRRGE